jgi:hypothetical protein
MNQCGLSRVSDNRRAACAQAESNIRTVGPLSARGRAPFGKPGFIGRIDLADGLKVA